MHGLVNYWVRSFLPSHLYAFLTRSHIPDPLDFRKLLVARHIVRSGDDVVDGGAHVGYHTRFYSQLVGKEGRVFSFEPNPYIYKFLNKYAKTMPQVVAKREALHDKANKKLSFYLHPRTLQQDSTLEPRLKNSGHKKVVVSTTTLDALPLRKLKLIKLDVEGHEEAVFWGGKATLQRFAPWIIFEYQKNAKRDDGRVVQTLEKLGYRCWDLARLRWVKGEESCNLTDLLALPAAVIDKEMPFLTSLEYH